MKTKKFYLIFLMVAITTMIISCKKEEQPKENSPGVTLSLSADPATIKLGGESVLFATARGLESGNVSYKWSVNTSSTIVGRDSLVRLWASCPSCTGINEVTCTVADAKNIVTKKITVNILQ